MNSRKAFKSTATLLHITSFHIIHLCEINFRDRSVQHLEIVLEMVSTCLTSMELLSVYKIHFRLTMSSSKIHLGGHKNLILLVHIRTAQIIWYCSRKMEERQPISLLYSGNSSSNNRHCKVEVTVNRVKVYSRCNIFQRRPPCRLLHLAANQQALSQRSVPCR